MKELKNIMMTGLIMLVSSAILISCNGYQKDKIEVSNAPSDAVEVVKEIDSSDINGYDAGDFSMPENEDIEDHDESVQASAEEITASDPGKNAAISNATLPSPELNTPKKPMPIAEDENPKSTAPVLDHSTWDRLLKKHVDAAGDVHYSNFLEDKDTLNKYLEYLAKNPPTNSDSKNERLAYYINLYNAATVKLILDNYPVKSIKDIKNPWERSWVQVGDKQLSLGQIENDILRKMNEPRIHFAINCASYSCPKMISEAFTASKMGAQLERTTREFIRDEKRNKLSAELAQLSNIFDWYKDDFVKNGSLIDYINPYSGVEIAPNAKVTYLTYDWSLNDAK